MVALSAACGGPSQTPSAPLPDASFDAQVVYSSDAVAIHYTFTNNTSEPVLVLNRPERHGSTAFDAASAYVIGLGGGRVQISQRMIEKPDTDTDYASLPRIGATSVEPGGSVSGDLILPVPLEGYSPWADGEYADGESEPDPVPDDVVFCLGVLSPPFEEPAAEKEADEWIALHGSVRDQALFCSEPVPADR